MAWRGERRRATDNVDLSGSEHAWWNGGGRTTGTVLEAPAAPPGPPPGVPERRQSPTPPPSPAPAATPVQVPPELDPGPADPWNRSTSPQVTYAYRTLGIDWEATWEEVVEQFRALAEHWHPDRLASADPAVQAEGQRRMSEFNRAYAELRRILRPARRGDLFSS